MYFFSFYVGCQSCYTARIVDFAFVPSLPSTCWSTNPHTHILSHSLPIKLLWYEEPTSFCCHTSQTLLPRSAAKINRRSNALHLHPRDLPRNNSPHNLIPPPNPLQRSRAPLGIRRLRGTTPPLANPSPTPPLTLIFPQQQIHPNLSHRDMTPAWPIARTSSEASFSAALDERTIAVRNIVKKRGGGSTRTLAWSVLAGKFGLGRREVAEVSSSSPVLRPRKEMRYYFTS